MGFFKQFVFGLLTGLAAAGLILLVNGRLEQSPIQLSSSDQMQKIRISIQGAVLHPGIYSLEPDSILQDAINAAGGTTSDADLTRVKLASLLSDGQEVRIPTQIIEFPTDNSGSTNSTTSHSGKINLNTATLAELDSLPGIGPAIAQRIIDYRTDHGPFQNVEELLNVKGIGPSLFEKIKDLVEAP